MLSFNINVTSLALILWLGMLIIAGSIWVLSSQVRKLADLYEENAKSAVAIGQHGRSGRGPTAVALFRGSTRRGCSSRSRVVARVSASARGPRSADPGALPDALQCIGEGGRCDIDIPIPDRDAPITSVPGRTRRGSTMAANQGLIGGKAVDWRHRLDLIIEMMREMSLQTDPQAMVRAYGKRIRQIMPANRYVALSRRDLEFPKYRITRSSQWKDEIDPWKQKDRLPLLEGGLFGELIYGDEPRIIDELEVSPDDPAAAYLEGHALAHRHPPLRPGGRPQHGRPDEARARRLRPRGVPRAGLDEQPVRPGDAQPCAGRGAEAGLRHRGRRAEAGRRHPAVAPAPVDAGRSPASTWPRTTRRRGGPAATTTTSSPCPTAGAAS